MGMSAERLSCKKNKAERHAPSDSPRHQRKLHGKEGVDGSSPSEGFAEMPAKTAASLVWSVNACHARALGVFFVHDHHKDPPARTSRRVGQQGTPPTPGPPRGRAREPPPAPANPR